MRPAERAARELTDALGDLPVGSLRVYGDFFGRPYDNQHRLVTASSSEDELTLRFDEGELLVITEPSGWTFGTSVLRVDDAVRVTWTWYLYARPKTAHNRRTIEHWIHGDVVRARIDGDEDRYRFTPSLEAAAVEVLTGPSSRSG